MSTPAWLNRRKETPSDVISLINTARLNSCWIFHYKSQKAKIVDKLKANKKNKLYGFYFFYWLWLFNSGISDVSEC